MSKSKPIIWVTRPEPGNERSCARLHAMGCDVRAVPLTRIEPLPVSMTGSDLAPDTVLAVTSANAIRHLTELSLQALMDCPLYAVGEATAGIARTSGFKTVIESQGDAAELAAVITEQTPPSTPIVYLTGKTRAGTFESSLKDLGRANPTIIEIYATKKVSQITYIENELKAGAIPDAILFHSAMSVHGLAEQMTIESLEKTRFICISERVANALPESLHRKITIAKRPDEAHMMDAVFAR